MKKEKIKIGLDFHGVLATNPQYFSVFCRKVMEKGWELHIISGGPRKDILQYLKVNDIPFTKIYTILETCDKAGVVEYYADGSFYVEEEIWNRAKGVYCRENKINLHIDDSKYYEPYFSTPFCLYKLHKGKCTLENKNLSIRFTDGVDAAIGEIENYLSLTAESR